MKTHRLTGGGGVRLHVVETGNPQGRPIVFIHGASQCWLQWSRQMNSGLAADHRLVALDMRMARSESVACSSSALSRSWAVRRRCRGQRAVRHAGV